MASPEAKEVSWFTIPRQAQEKCRYCRKRGLDFTTEQGLNIDCVWEILGKTIQGYLQAVAFCRDLESGTGAGGVGWGR